MTDSDLRVSELPAAASTASSCCTWCDFGGFTEGIVSQWRRLSPCTVDCSFLHREKKADKIDEAATVVCHLLNDLYRSTGIQIDSFEGLSCRIKATSSAGIQLTQANDLLVQCGKHEEQNQKKNGQGATKCSCQLCLAIRSLFANRDVDLQKKVLPHVKDWQQRVKYHGLWF